jgi:hypothetical protein
MFSVTDTTYLNLNTISGATGYFGVMSIASATISSGSAGGASGQSGWSGWSGPAGSPGTPGTPGTPGDSGQSGWSGPIGVGTSGQSGWSGLAGTTGSGAINCIFDGGGILIPAAETSWVMIPYACSINAWQMTSDISGNAVVDVQRATYSNFPTFTTIAGSELPTLSNQNKNQDTNLTTWTQAIAVGDYIRFSLSSNTAATYIYVTLETLKS